MILAGFDAQICQQIKSEILIVHRFLFCEQIEWAMIGTSICVDNRASVHIYYVEVP